MGKMNELSLAVTELQRCGEALIMIADTLGNLFRVDQDSEHQTEEAPQEPVPEPKPITLEMVRAVLAEKSRAGHTTDVRMLLEKHGAVKLSEIDPAKYPALLSEAEVLGHG